MSPDPTMMALSREVRSILDTIQAHSSDDQAAEAERWFRSLEAAITCDRCGALRGTENALEPVPLVEPP